MITKCYFILPLWVGNEPTHSVPTQHPSSPLPTDFLLSLCSVPNPFTATFSSPLFFRRLFRPPACAIFPQALSVFQRNAGGLRARSVRFFHYLFFLFVLPLWRVQSQLLFIFQDPWLFGFAI